MRVLPNAHLDVLVRDAEERHLRGFEFKRRAYGAADVSSVEGTRGLVPWRVRETGGRGQGAHKKDVFAV